MSIKVLLSTEKPFTPAAVKEIEAAFSNVDYELVKLEKYTDKQDLLDAVKDVDAMIIRSDKVTADVIAVAQKLKVVVRAGAGFDNIDLKAATEKNICAMNTPGQNSNAVAELAIGLMLYMARNKFTSGSGTELRGKKIGIHAYGNVGRYVATIAKGFGMETYAFDPYVERSKMESEGIIVVDSQEELYETCDYISLHIPVNDSTRKSINYDLLSKMKKGGTLINTARKEVICEEGLVKIMNERDDLKYSTDVAPLVHSEMAEKFGNRYHGTAKKMGAGTSEANINAGLASANQIINFLKNGDRTFQVNK
jgi:D-3-phosphoglycerate dehydrogenase / 2-oxoglutarate reductase